ncbi:MAG: type VII secretion protein EccB [Bifidobacteriaceae bacterium]|jgi:type VII secretion protein EccB|nr:type VII secretion protein EccB [Bifidobacteriaceae bacterium]
MATKKELVQAQSFARRRLLTAFASGIPDGKELEPVKPMRAVTAGIALAVIVIVGGLVAGLISPTLPEGWENGRLIITESDGARYVSIESSLYPVINTASARLALDPGQFDVLSVDADQISGAPRGHTIGIAGAPEDLPAPDRLVNSGWTACLTEPAAPEEPAGIAVDIVSAGPSTAPAASAVLAKTADDGATSYLIAGGTRYPVKAPNATGILSSLGFNPPVPLLTVPAAWLNLFAPGAELDKVDIQGAGEAPAEPLVLDGAAVPVGRLIEIGRGADELGTYVLTAAGELAALTPVAKAMYEYSGSPFAAEPILIDRAAVGQVRFTKSLPYPGDWPEEVAAMIPAGIWPCATATGELERPAATRLDLPLAGAQSLVAGGTPGSPLKPGVRVEDGHGALVFTGMLDPTGQNVVAPGYRYLVDHSGTAFPIPDHGDDALERLGYQAEQMGAAPAEWVALLPPGPGLSVDAARSPPAEAEPGGGAPGPVGTIAEPSAKAEPAAALADEGCAAENPAPIDSESPYDAMLAAAQARQVATGHNIVVAVVDSGVEAPSRHLSLDRPVSSGKNLVPDGADRNGWTDLSGHGTAIAGIIAAQEIPGSGVVGLAPGAKILPVRIYDKEENLTSAGIAQGIRAAADLGAKVINVSASAAQDPGDAILQAVAHAEAAGALVVASVGNPDKAQAGAGTEPAAPVPTTQLRYPAGYPGVIAVAAADRSGAVTDASYHGPHVDIAAPGQGVLTVFLGGGDCFISADAPSSSYATAFVSGAAALVAERFPDEGPDMWSYRLMASALRPTPDARDDRLGWGLLQPHAALTDPIDTALPGPPFPGADNTRPAPAAPPPVVAVVRPSPLVAVRQRTAVVAVLAASATAAVVVLGRAPRARRRARAARPGPG